MEYDANGNPVVYVIYDRSRPGTTTSWWQVATFRFSENAQQFIDEQKNENYMISCQSARTRDLSMARD